MTRLFPTAAVVLLLTGTAAAELPPEIWFSPCGDLEPTCNSPRVSQYPDLVPVNDIELRTVHRPVCDKRGLEIVETADERSPYFVTDVGSNGEQEPAIVNASTLLDRWENASRSHLPVTEAERLRLHYASSQQSGQEVSLTCELQGPIRADDLARRYRWVVSYQRDSIELTGTPNDELERLFYRQFIVTLDAATWRPTSLRFNSERIGDTVVLAPVIDESSDTKIQLVGYESEHQPLRTADASGESSGLMSHDPPHLVPPPAPAECIPDNLVPIEALRPVQ